MGRTAPPWQPGIDLDKEANRAPRHRAPSSRAGPGRAWCGLDDPARPGQGLAGLAAHAAAGRQGQGHSLGQSACRKAIITCSCKACAIDGEVLTRGERGVIVVGPRRWLRWLVPSPGGSHSEHTCTQWGRADLRSHAAAPRRGLPGPGPRGAPSPSSLHRAAPHPREPRRASPSRRSPTPRALRGPLRAAPGGAVPGNLLDLARHGAYIWAGRARVWVPVPGPSLPGPGRPPRARQPGPCQRNQSKHDNYDRKTIFLRPMIL